MTNQEAANVIANVCAKWEGTIAQGEVVREAYRTLTVAAGVVAAGVDAGAVVPPVEPPTPPNRAARRAKGPAKKAARS